MSGNYPDGLTQGGFDRAWEELGNEEVFGLDPLEPALTPEEEAEELLRAQWENEAFFVECNIIPPDSEDTQPEIEELPF